jgi:hypothetical protein
MHTLVLHTKPIHKRPTVLPVCASVTMEVAITASDFVLHTMAVHYQATSTIRITGITAGDLVLHTKPLHDHGRPYQSARV